MTLYIYGINNCTTVKKAKAWLDDKGVDYTFFDFKKTPPTKNLIEQWFKEFGWESVVNKRGTTYRNLDANIKESLNQHSAIDVLLSAPSMIKRPILFNESNQVFLLGFDPDAYQELCAQII